MQNDQQNQSSNKILLAWNIPEYTQYERNRSWYFIMGLVMAIILIYCFFTFNFLFALIIILFVLLLYIQTRRQPQDVLIKITEDGLFIGNDFYEYKTLKNFWLIYEPPAVKNLYLAFKSAIKPILKISMEKQNPLDIRQILLQFLDEDLSQEEEPFGDLLRRKLKI